MSSTRMKQLLQGCILLLVSTVLVLILGELTARAWYWYKSIRPGSLEKQLEQSRDITPTVITGSTTMRGLVQPSQFNDVVYELKPKITATFQKKLLQTNSLGMREREVSIEKQPNTTRIVGIGDSVMFGWGVNVEDTYLKRIESRLNACATGEQRYEVLNFAVPGYNAAMEAALFEHKVVKFDPDLVVIHFVSNDLSVPLFMERLEDPLSMQSSFLWSAVETQLKSLNGDDDEDFVNAHFEGLDKKSRRQVLRPYWHMLGPRGYKRAMKVVAHTVAPKKTPVLLVYGSASKKKQELLSAVAKKRGFHLLPVRPYVDAYVQTHNIPDTPEARQAALAVSSHDSHPNPRGHEIYATALLDQLVGIGFIPVTMQSCIRAKAEEASS